MSRHLQWIFLLISILGVIFAGCTHQNCCEVNEVASISWPAPPPATAKAKPAQEEKKLEDQQQATATAEMQPIPEESISETQNPEPSQEGNLIEGNQTSPEPYEIPATEFPDAEASGTPQTAPAEVEISKEKLEEELSEEDMGQEDIGKEAMKTEGNVQAVPTQAALKESIELKIDAPDRVYKSNEFVYNLSVFNKGTEPVTSLVLKNQLDAQGVLFVACDASGNYNEGTKVITWDIPELKSNASQNFKLTVKAQDELNEDVYTLVNKSLVKVSNSIVARQKKQTQIYGVPGLQVNHYDTTDPVSVGSSTTYIVEIKNQGVTDVHDLQIINNIPEESEFESAEVEFSGTVPGHKVEGKRVIFDVIPKLSQGEHITFKIKVKAILVGDLLNTVEIHSGEFSGEKALKKQEPTKAVTSQD